MNCTLQFDNQTITIKNNSYEIISNDICTDLYFTEILEFLDRWFSDNDSLEVQTSGTTGTPKKIMVLKKHMINSALATGEFLQLAANNKALCCLPISFIAGKMMLIRSIVLNLNTLIVKPSQNPFSEISEEFDFTAITPMQALLNIDKLHHFKKILIGSAKVQVDLEEKLLNIPAKIYETFASTETLSHIALREIGNQYFETLPNISIDTNQEKCLIIKAPKILNNELITNDIIHKISPTEFVWIGRLDNVINSGGIKIFPEKIETKLQPFMKKEFIIKGIPDAILGEKVALFIQSNPYEFDTNIFDVLEKYEKPKAIFFVENFPKTPTGKIKRNEVGQ